jgi:hypothetical protein
MSQLPIRVGRWLAAVVGAVLLLAVACFGTFVGLRKARERPVIQRYEEFHAALAARDFQAAYAIASPTLRQRLRREAFMNLFSNYGAARYAIDRHTDLNVSQDQAWVTPRAGARETGVFTPAFRFVRIEGVWYVADEPGTIMVSPWE